MEGFGHLPPPSLTPCRAPSPSQNSAHTFPDTCMCLLVEEGPGLVGAYPCVYPSPLSTQAAGCVGLVVGCVSSSRSGLGFPCVPFSPAPLSQPYT